MLDLLVRGANLPDGRVAQDIAVKDGHIIALNDDIASRWGPRITNLVRTVEAATVKGSGT